MTLRRRGDSNKMASLSGKGWSILGKDQNEWAARRLRTPVCAAKRHYRLLVADGGHRLHPGAVGAVGSVGA
jgi:hypothetical protein